MTRATDATVRVRLAVWVRAGLLESATWKVSRVLVTDRVGVPVRAPEEAFRDKPVGRVPLSKAQL